LVITQSFIKSPVRKEILKGKAKMLRKLAVIVVLLGVVGIVLGGVFLGQGFAKNNLIVDRMKIENVTLALNPDNPNVYTSITDIESAQKAADTIAEHRRSIAHTYQQLLGDGRYDPNNPTHLTYAQAMNLENYLYLAVAAFGLVQVALGSGAFMVIIGIAFVVTGVILFNLTKTL
jgi:hypothetical protein